MDLLFKEYASPFLLLDGIISSGRLCEFLQTFRTQREERQRWDYYVNKVPAWNEMTWEEFNRRCNSVSIPVKEKVTNEQLETTVGNSFTILNNFIPD